MITRENLDRLRCEIVCGAANNAAEDSLAADLDARGILYAPDFIVNSGGLISVYWTNSLPRERTEEPRRPDRRGARDDPRRGR